MNKTILILALMSLNLFGGCLDVGTTTGQSCTDDTINVDFMTTTFSSTMKVSDNNLNVLEIPIYVASDTTEAVSMTISELSALQNSDHDIIDTKLEYIQGGSVVATITNGTAFTLLADGESSRDGNTEVGRIRITINSALSDTQTAGSYKLSKSMTVKLGNGSDSSSETLESRGVVEQVSMVGFENLSSYTTGQAFKNGLVDYGNFTLNSANEQIKDIFVKNNTNGDFQLKFETSDLISQIDSNYKIAMSYYYKKTDASEQSISNNQYFTIMSGKNNGSKVGEMRFVTEPLTSSLIAGEYKATINVTVQAQ